MNLLPVDHVFRREPEPRPATLRRDIAKDFLAGMLANPNLLSTGSVSEAYSDLLTDTAVTLADALLKRLASER